MNQADMAADAFENDNDDNDNGDDNGDGDGDDDTASKNPHPSDGEAAIGDSTAAGTNNATNPSTDGVGSAPSGKKRTTIDESALSTEDLQKLESRRAYNRQCAAKARKRSKTLVAQLQAQVEELTKDKAELKRSNTLMRTQLDLLEQQNRTLLMNQSSSSGQMNLGSFVPGGAMPNNMGNPSIGAVASMSGGNPMFNLGSTRFGASSTGTIGSGCSVGGANNLSNASTSFMGVGTGGGGGSLGQLSLLDRLRLQQQIQLQQQQQIQLQQQQHIQLQHQQQQLGLMASSSSGNSRTSLSDEDVVPNNVRNNNNADTNNNLQNNINADNNFLG